MRINAIKLEWFRGSASEVALEVGSKSSVVYGPNGSGKSSFVDAVEYVVNKGKLDHLSHEYSGKRQERGIINTHTPTGAKSGLSFSFQDGKDLSIAIATTGSHTMGGSGLNAMDNWEYRRTILRQNEVADFITGTKGEKYSAILPLLGLRPLELIAENFRQLARTTEKESKITECKVRMTSIQRDRIAKLGNVNDQSILTQIDDLYKKYCPASPKEKDLKTQCSNITIALDKQINDFSASKRTNVALVEIGSIPLELDIDNVRSIASKLAGEADPLIRERLDTLRAAELFGNKTTPGATISCPACGQDIGSDDFNAHIEKEKKRSQSILAVFTSHRAAVASLCNNVSRVKQGFIKDDLKKWKADISDAQYVYKFEKLSKIDIELLRGSCTEEDLKNLENDVLPLVVLAASMGGVPSDDVRKLMDDQSLVKVGEDTLEDKVLSEQVKKVEELVRLMNSFETAARQEIRDSSAKIIADISGDIQEMWEILHPDKKVEEVRLNLPVGVDKSIDIHLKFYGIDQDSPRLTLSEGNRNSLGLCIFLAMARCDQEDRPLFLDDVIISMDRGYRGMIVDLLVKKFGDRQVFIFTHDREWFVELRQRLDKSQWSFKSLMPWDEPVVGIRWSARSMNFDDARKNLDTAPDLAGNEARKIMDIELAPRAERLKIRLPYFHRERNDHRMAHDFLDRFIKDGKECFEIKKDDDTGYRIYDEAISAFNEADTLLIAFGNKASHGYDIEKNEVEKLIEASEKAVNYFECPKCNQQVGRLEDQASGFMQCGCSNLRWRYGKV